MNRDHLPKPISCPSKWKTKTEAIPALSPLPKEDPPQCRSHSASDSGSGDTTQLCSPVSLRGIQYPSGGTAVAPSSSRGGTDGTVSLPAQLGRARPAHRPGHFFGGCSRGLKPHADRGGAHREWRGWSGSQGGQGRSDTAPGAALGQEVAGWGLLQQGCEDALQLRQAGAQRGAGEQVQLVGRVQGQDGDEPPAPRRAVCRSLERREGETPRSGAARGMQGWPSAASLMANSCSCQDSNTSFSQGTHLNSPFVAQAQNCWTN